MTVIKEKLSDIKEQYEKAQSLINDESKNDPVTEPYRSHYKAQEVLFNLEKNIKNLQGETEDPVLDAIKCHVYKEIARIYMHTEELSNADKYFKKAIEFCSERETDPRFIIGCVDTLNQTSILWSNWDNSEVARKTLDQAEKAYKDFKEKKEKPLTISDLFGSPEEVEEGKGDLALEKLYTLTLYYLAQVIGNSGDLHTSAKYCHITLKRQLEFKDYEPIDWALNAATLSQFFFTQNYLKQSRHLLAAASYMLDRYEQDLCTSELNEEQRQQKVEVLNHRSADIARCWAKYDIHILNTSKERLMDDQESDLADDLSKKLQVSKEFEEFKTLSLSLYENQVTADFVLTYDDAKLVFLNAQSWLTKAKEYYTIESEASEYARIQQDHASLYKYLAFFDDDESNQCKFHKRRADMLEELVEALNSTYYLVICRETWYELGLTYSTMLDIKLGIMDRLPDSERPTPHMLNKINKLMW